MVSTLSLVSQTPAWQPAPGHITLPIWPQRRTRNCACGSTRAGRGRHHDGQGQSHRRQAAHPAGQCLHADDHPLQAREGEWRNACGCRVSRRRISHPGHRSRRDRGMRLAEFGGNHLRAAQISRPRLRSLSQVLSCVTGRAARGRHCAPKSHRMGHRLRSAWACWDSQPAVISRLP